MPQSARPTAISDLVEMLSEEVVKRVTIVERRRSQAQEINDYVTKAEKVFGERSKYQKILDDSKARLNEVSKKKDLVDEHVISARRLAQAAGAAKTKLLNQVFKEALNKLWRDLYRRLARLEDFVPQLAEPTLYRGKIETHIAGTMAGVTPFNNFAAVSSLGNLNTAALSLFLALNLVEEPKHHILLLDDPVQNMDDACNPICKPSQSNCISG